MPRYSNAIRPGTRRKATTPRKAPVPTQGGFSLIEVLVSILVFALGLVGMLSMTVATLENNKAAQMRMTGVGLVNEYAERARMNIRAFDTGSYSIALSDTAGSTTVATDPAATKGTAATSMASADKQSLLKEVAQRLPQGDAVVVSQGTSASRNLHIWLLWEEPTAAAGSIAAALFAQTQQICPKSLTATEKAKYSCMYFMVPL